MIEVRLLNEDFELAGILDVFESFIWTERYNECGDFEFYAHVTSDILETIHTGMYLQIADSDFTMIIEYISLDHNYEEGDHITIKGRSLESILDRRIIWNPVIYQDITIGSLIKTLIYDNIIDPEDPDRRVSNFIFHEPVEVPVDEHGDELYSFSSVQLFGENLYDVILQLCQTYKLGFKIVWEDGNYVFYLYSGKDRSYEQDINPYIVFSPEYDNILNSNFITSTDGYKTICLVGGEGEGNAQTRIEVKLDDVYTGFDRREIYIDEGSITTNDGEITLEEYKAQLFQRGAEALSEMSVSTSFDGQIDPTQLYIYGRDYNLGDVVQVVNDFGMTSTTRVAEYIRSYSTSGIEAYPTFSTDLESESTSYSTVHDGTSGGGGGGGSFSGVHNDLNGRSESDTHPISSITRLDNELDARPNTSITTQELNDICI